MYALISKKTGSPISIRHDGYGEKIVVWESEEAAISFIGRVGDHLNDYTILKVSSENAQQIANACYTTTDKISYVNYLDTPQGNANGF